MADRAAKIPDLAKLKISKMGLPKFSRIFRSRKIFENVFPKNDHRTFSEWFYASPNPENIIFIETSRRLFCPTSIIVAIALRTSMSLRTSMGGRRFSEHRENCVIAARSASCSLRFPREDALDVSGPPEAARPNWASYRCSRALTQVHLSTW